MALRSSRQQAAGRSRPWQAASSKLQQADGTTAQ